MIEQSLGLLECKKIDDNKIITYAKSMIKVAKDDIREYKVFLDMVYSDLGIKEKAYNGKRLTASERILLDEMMRRSNLGEYAFKGDYQSCCYPAMKAFLIALYCLLLKGIEFNIKSVDLIADLDDCLQTINIYESDTKRDFIIVEWYTTNKIDSMYTLYKTKYSG